SVPPSAATKPRAANILTSDEAANGTINRDLAVLNRMLRLAYKNGKLQRLPMIEKLKEADPRSWFSGDATLTRPLLDDAAGTEQHRLRDREAKSSRRLEVDDQLEGVGLLDRKVRRLGALEDLRDEPGRLTPHLVPVGPVARQSSPLHVKGAVKHRRDR